MDPLHHALRAARADVAAPAYARHGLVIGAGGALGSALLEHSLGSGRFASVRALATSPIDAGMRGFEALPFGGFDDAAVLAGIDTAWIVFDRERHANGRDDAFYRPQPESLPALAGWLHAGGVRRLLIVVSHAPGLLPQALRHGLASLDEHAVAALGFEQLVIVRSAQAAPELRAATWPQRMAQLWLAQLRWMIPQREQAVRLRSVAAFAVQIALALDGARPGTRVVPPDLVWQAARSDDLPALAQAWLDGSRG